MPIQVKGWKAGIGDFKFVVPVKLNKFSPEALLILPKSAKAKKQYVNYLIKQALEASEGRFILSKAMNTASFEQQNCCLAKAHEMFYEKNIVYFIGQLQKIDFFYGAKCLEKFVRKMLPNILPEIKLKEKNIRIATETTRSGVDFVSNVIFRLSKGKDTQPYLVTFENGGRTENAQPLLEAINKKMGLNLRFDENWRG